MYLSFGYRKDSNPKSFYKVYLNGKVLGVIRSKMALENYDFSGWATKNDILCSDGRTIRQNAFKDNDGQIVPLVYGHSHDNPMNVLGHALLVNKPEGVRAYGKFNDTEAGQQSFTVRNGRFIAVYFQSGFIINSRFYFCS